VSFQDTAELLDVIKTRGTVPVNAGNWTDASLLRTASEVLRTWHLPLLVNAKGEYLVKETQMPCVVGQREMLLSPRAAAVRLLSLLGSDNVERPLDDLTPTAQSQLYLDRSRKGVPLYFSFREGYVQLFPLPMSTSYSLKVLWHMRPGRLVLTSDCWQILSITADSPSAGLSRLAFATVAPTAMAGALNTNKYEFTGVNNPFPVKGFDVTVRSLVTALASTTMDFTTSELPTDLAAGDWVAPQGKTPIPNMPEELHVPLALRTAAVAVGSRQSALRDALNAEAKALENNLLNGILAPRSKGNPRRLVQRRWMRR
jgi:hypothetical protein